MQIRVSKKEKKNLPLKKGGTKGMQLSGSAPA
jgi:hypothetical protein